MKGQENSINNYDLLLGRTGIPYISLKESIPSNGSNSLSNPERVWSLCKDTLYMCEKAEEYVYCLCLDAKGDLLGIFEISHGNVSNSIIDVRSIFQRALLVGAVRIILTHNHPSGSAVPSEADMEVTKRVQEAGKLLNIPLLDHVIVSREGYRSIMQDGGLE